jgi:hypothetical protein
MSIAPQNIMSQLRGMEDAELAKYAQMHQQDPYIFPLAFQESQNRQHIRLAKEAQMAGQQQPKVVQQDLSQMAQMAAPQMPPQQMAQLPEQMGIGQLPAQNMEAIGKAEGGIIGYAEGGHIPRYQGNDTDGSVVKSARERLREQLYSLPSGGRPGMSYAGNVPTAVSTLRPEEAPPQFLAPGVPNPAYAAYLKREAARDRGVDPQAYDPNLYPINTNAISTTPATASTDVVATKTGSGDVQPTPPNADQNKPLPPKPAAPAMPSAGLPSISKYMEDFNKALPTKESIDDEAKYLEKRGAPFKEVRDKTFDYINKQKDQLKTDKEQEFYMSLIEGGLAAAGEGGPNAIQNIAKGFSKGAGRYGEALKDFRKAAQENSKMELELARAEAADKKGDMDAYERHTDKAKDRNSEIDKLKAHGLSSLMAQDVHGKYQLASTAMHGQFQMAAAGAPGAQERLFSALGGGDLEKGARLFTDIQAGKRTLTQSYEDYMKAWAGKDTTMGAPLTPQQYVQQIQQLQMAASPPPKPGAATGKVFE